MELTVTPHEPGVTEIAVRGRLNMVTAAQLRSAIESAILDNRPRVAIDVSGVVFLDSSGLGALIAGLKSARAAGGDVRLVRPPEQVQLVLELTNMGGILQSFENVEAAYGRG